MQEDKQLNLFSIRQDTFISYKGESNEHHPFILLNYDENSVTYKSVCTYVFKIFFDSQKEADKFYNEKYDKISNSAEPFDVEINIPSLFKYDTNKYSEYGYCKAFDYHGKAYENTEEFKSSDSDTKILWYQEKLKHYQYFVDRDKDSENPPPVYFDDLKILKSTQKILNNLLKDKKGYEL